MVKKKPIKILTLDTETYQGLIGKLKRIAIYDGQKITYGYTFEEVEKDILELSKRFNIHIYIHNLEFDARKMPELFDNKRIIWDKCFIINGKLATITTKHYVIHDSFKLLPNSLKKLSKDFDVEHGKLDLWGEVEKKYPGEYTDIVDFLDRCDIDNELYLEYLGYDVMSLYEVLEVLQDIAGLELKDFVKRISTASLSRYIFKNGYKGKIFKRDDQTKTDFEMLSQFNWKNDLGIEEFLRASYCGGRTEVFKPWLKSQGFHYDVNSLYPSVMIGVFYPVGKPFFTEKAKQAQAFFEKWQSDRQGLGFICADVFIPKQHIPPLPVKMGKLTFPCGHVFGTWTYEELEYAVKECGVVIEKYQACCHFEKTYQVFDNFVKTFYQLKEQATKEKNPSLRALAKLLLNVGYGYTGMRRDDKTSIKAFEKISDYDEIKFANEELGFIEVPTEITAEYIQVQVASYVTSRARLILLKALRDVEHRGGNVYYCDTDSIVSDIEFNPSIVNSSKLGFWDCEGKPLQGIFLRPKVYSEILDKVDPDTKKNLVNVKFKGITRETQKTLDFDSYEHLYQELQYMKKDYEIIEKNKLQMRSVMYMKKNELDFDYHEYRDKKMNFNTVEKRLMNYIGNYTKPLFFDTLEKFENFNFKGTKKTVEYNMEGMNYAE